MEYADDMEWYPSTEQAFFFGGDHIYDGLSDYARFVRYTASGNNWEILPRPAWVSNNPGTMHGYDEITINMQTGDLYTRAHNKPRYDLFFKYNIPSNTWTQLPGVPSSMVGGTYDGCACDAIEYVPELGGIIFVDGSTGRIYLFKESTQQWSVLANVSLAYGENAAEYNPVHKITVILSGNKVYKISATGQVTAMQNSPISCCGGSGHYGNFTFDPVTGTYLYLTQTNRTFYSYDVLSDTWQARSGAPNLANQAIISASVSTYGVNMFVACGGGGCQTWLYKHSTGGGVPVPPPAPPPPPPAPPPPTPTPPPPSSPCSSLVTSASQIITESLIAKPALGQNITDVNFGNCVQIKRIVDAAALGSGEAVPAYSKLQAWNSDRTKIHLQSGHILNANNYTVFRLAPYMPNPRWSPVDPNIIYTTRANQFVSYNIQTGAFTVLHTFTEYIDFDNDTTTRESQFEEISLDGRYTAMIGKRTSGTYEAFSYDIQNDIKSPVLVVSGRPCGLPNNLQMSPSGNYVIVNWAAGGDSRYCTVESYDRNMNFVGTVATGHGHGDLIEDSSGVEWFVDFSPDNYVGITGPVIKKNRVPNGYDQYKAGDQSAIKTLLRLDWSHSMHISCQGPVGINWCVAGTYNGESNGWQQFEGEIFKVYLDSIDAYPAGSGPSNPHIERLAHHRSNPVVCGDNYWLQPHASINRDGTQIIFGSHWRSATCAPEAYILELTGAGAIPLGDLNGDRIINSIDFSIMNAVWLTNNVTADLNKDGIVNSLDFSIMNSNWLKTY